MGQIRIQVVGSFTPVHDKTFSALKSGHTVAVDDAIRFLERVKKEALANDTSLYEQGHEPEDGFATARGRGLLDAGEK